MNISLYSLLTCDVVLLCTELGACGSSHRSTRRKSGRAMRKHRSFCLPESEQASRQARQEPDGTMVEARDDGLSGSGTDGQILVER